MTAPRRKYEPTPEEVKGGWTEDTLRAYHRKRNLEASKTIFKNMERKNKKQTIQNYKLHPFKWRKRERISP